MTFEEEVPSSQAILERLTAEVWRQTALPAAGAESPCLKSDLVAHCCDRYSQGDIKPATQSGVWKSMGNTD